jgi:hypothetical protein
VSNDPTDVVDVLGLEEEQEKKEQKPEKFGEPECTKLEHEGNVRYAIVSFGHPPLGGNFVIPGEKLTAGLAAGWALKKLLIEALRRIPSVSGLVRAGIGASTTGSAKITTMGIWQCCICENGLTVKWGELHQQAVTSDDIFTLDDAGIRGSILEQSNQVDEILDIITSSCTKSDIAPETES